MVDFFKIVFDARFPISEDNQCLYDFKKGPINAENQNMLTSAFSASRIHVM